MPARVTSRPSPRFDDPDDDDDGCLDYGDIPGFVDLRMKQLSARVARELDGRLSGDARKQVAARPVSCLAASTFTVAGPKSPALRRDGTHADYLRLCERLCEPPPPPPETRVRTPAEDEATCFHEAGHAVAALARGVPVIEATAEPTHQAGRCLAEGHVRHNNCAPYDTAIIVYAGTAAERRFSLGRGGIAGWDREILDALRLSDRTHELAEAEAGRIVERYARPIREIARALREERTLDGGRLRSLFRRAL